MGRYPKWSALLFGLLTATGFPPLHAWPVALVAMGGFVWLLYRASSWKRAFVLGWLFGVAHFTLTNNWIATAFTYQAEMPAILGWAAVPLLSLYLAVWPGLAALAAKLVVRGRGMVAFALALGAMWIAAEWLRSWVFSGYAWGPFSLAGLGGWSRPGLAALLPFGGTYALSGIMVSMTGLAAALLLRRQWLPLVAVAAAVVAGMVWPAPTPQQGRLPLTLVQPNLQQDEIDDPSKFEEQFRRIARLSRPERRFDHRLVLWPESGVPDYLREGYPQRYYDQRTVGGSPAFARYRIARAIGEGSALLTGTVDLEIGDRDGVIGATGAYNVVTPVFDDGALGLRYAKAHLVPYGEYLPMREWLEPVGLSRLVAGTLDFIPGPGPQTIDLGPWGKVGTQICYEIVFSGEVTDRAERPDYIFNPSNDGWFGSWGPPQHLAQARMRALEEGLPVLRSTTTGISAVIDTRGVVRDHLDRGVAGRIDTMVPPAADPTPFAKMGHWLTLVWFIALLALSMVAITLSRRYEMRHT